MDEFTDIDYQAAEVRKTFPFICRRCSPARNVPLRIETLTKICAELAKTETPRLDLSAVGLGIR